MGAAVIVGVGQVANKDDDRIVHPVDLLEEAARLAFADAGADLADRIGVVYSAPLSIFSEEHGGGMVAERLGLAPGPRIQSTYTGSGPQHHLGMAAAEIAAGTLDAALIVGGVAEASVRRAKQRGIEPPAPPTSIWSQGSGGTGKVRPVGDWKRPFSAEHGAGALLPSTYFALVESAMAHAAGHSPDAHRLWLGQLLAPFTDMAATRPDVAWFPTPRHPDDIATVTDDNRFIAEPYTKLMCSFPTVDLAAAVVVASVELADRLGIPTGGRVHPLAATVASEAGEPSVRPVLHESRALTDAAARALEASGVDVDDIDAFDLYSCFPAAVQLGMAAFGLDATDRRPRSLTGGLPYFGGPGASYTTHGIVAAVERCRSNDGRPVAVVGLGGAIDKFAVGLYSTEPPSRPVLAETEPTVPDDALVPVTRTTEGRGVVEAATVLHDRDGGPSEAPLIARLPDGSRVGARALDPELPAALVGRSLVGREVRLGTDGEVVFYEPTAAL